MAEIVEELAPTGDDERSGDTEYNPAMEPEKAKAWINMLRESEKAFEEWNESVRQHREAVRQPRVICARPRAIASSTCSGPTSKS